MPVDSISVLLPGAKLHFPIALPKDQKALMKQDGIEAITSGTVILRVFGYLEYEDIFRISHRTTFCMYLDRSLSGFSNCNTYNDAN